MLFLKPELPEGFVVQVSSRLPDLRSGCSGDLFTVKILVKGTLDMAAFAKVCIAPETKNLVIGVITVEVQYRRRGLASYIYDWVEYRYQRELCPTDVLEDAGQAFWAARIRMKQKQNSMRYLGLISGVPCT